MSDIAEQMREQEWREQETVRGDARLNVALPSAPESEEAVLSMLMNAVPEIYQRFASRLRADLFDHQQRVNIFMLLQDWHVMGRDFTSDASGALVTFTGEMRQRNELDAVGGALELSRLWTLFGFVTGNVFEFHLAQLEEMRARRGMIRAAWAMVATAKDTTENWKKGVEKAEGDLFNLHEQTSRRGTRHVREVLKPVLQEIKQAYESKGHISAGMQLGLTDLDRVTNGLKTGLFVIAARPSKGKTVLGCQLAVNGEFAIRNRLNPH
jgi:replicative DNA helicase